MAPLLGFLIGYLLGCFPSGYLAGRRARGIDIRTVGDGNTGAANVWREVGPLWGAAVFALDVAKGLLSVSIAAHLDASGSGVYLAGLGAVAGHNRPFVLGFRGGIGESTVIGVLLYLMPLEMGIVLAMAAVPLVITRNVIVASIFVFVPLPVLAWMMGVPTSLIVYGAVLPAISGLTHYMRYRTFRTRTVHP